MDDPDRRFGDALPDDLSLRTVPPDGAERLVGECWLPLAREMAAVDPRNALADGAREHAVAHKRDRLKGDDYAAFVAAGEGSWVGFATVERRAPPPVFERGPAAYLHELYVAPGRRREGIATVLLDAARAWARERGCERLALDVDAANGAARAFYADAGFEVARRRYEADL